MVLAVTFWEDPPLHKSICSILSPGSSGLACFCFLVGALCCLFPIILKKGLFKLSNWKENGEFTCGISRSYPASMSAVTGAGDITGFHHRMIVLPATFYGSFVGVLERKISKLSVVGIILSTLSVLTFIINGDNAGLYSNSLGAPGRSARLLRLPNWAIYPFFYARRCSVNLH
jgi:hypothetical protein